jgi:hypothetical protein
MQQSVRFARSLGFRAVSLLLLATLASLPLFAGDTDAERATLRQLGVVQVRVSETGADLTTGGYTREMLQSDVEARLRQAGIPVVTQNDAPIFYVSVNAVKGGLFSAYAYDVEVSVIQLVKLMRDPSIISPAPTWSLSQIGQAKKAREVREAVTPLVDRFVSLFRAMNPR